jgi:hypothetical protein
LIEVLILVITILCWRFTARRPHTNVKQIHKPLYQYHFLFRHFCCLVNLNVLFVCIINIQHFWFAIN